MKFNLKIYKNHYMFAPLAHLVDFENMLVSLRKDFLENL